MSEAICDHKSPPAELINELEAAIFNGLGTDYVEVELPLKHIFTPHLYTRHISMPKGSVVISREHLTQHPFFILKGDVSVYDQETGKSVRLKSGHFGVTEPGSRRVLLMHEDTEWATTHVTDLTDPDEIVREITSHDNPLLPDGFTDAAFENKQEELK